MEDGGSMIALQDDAIFYLLSSILNPPSSILYPGGLTPAAGVGYCERRKINPTIQGKSDEDNF